MPRPSKRLRGRAVPLLCLALAAPAAPCSSALGAGTTHVPGAISKLLSKYRGAASEAPGSQAGGTVAPATSTPSPTTLPPAASGTPTTSTVPPAGAGTAATGAPLGGSTVGTTRTTPAAARSSNGGVSDGAILAAVLAGLIACACLVWAVFRFGAFEPHWLLSLRHSLAEAGFRASATWAEFTDWLRLGH